MSPAPSTPPIRSLSPSRAADFMQCPLLFRFRVIDRLPERPSPAAKRGTLVHAVLERLFELPAETRTPDSALALLEPQWRGLREREPEVVEMFPDEEAVQAWLAEARALVRRYFDMESPQRLEPRHRELRMEVPLESGPRLLGYVDRVDVAPGGRVRIVDYKTGRRPRERYEDKARFQIFFYGVMLWRDTGRVPDRLQLLYLGDGTTRWYDPTEEELRNAEAHIRSVWDDITATARSGRWLPRRSPLCGWCDHRALCPAFDGTPPPLPGDAAEADAGSAAD
ncbi:PD-(D/E)XK nuclease family protein [Thermobifida halotolerans]|uniref:PD-(D/E)XK nuclease family protein n=1 Tax=Thermobifida halotolerans TaxID=483545 RepID=A0A399G615_9ACTN|nr:PD-(D/E)XK nuclease family protein [Thermobifida halotolerans]UOE21591.1 PD-(D/E)XK nuclease family protein [Thermobifida halotolerans]